MIFDELCQKLRFEVNYAKSQHRRISEALTYGAFCIIYQCMKYFYLREYWERVLLSKVDNEAETNVEYFGSSEIIKRKYK